MKEFRYTGDKRAPDAMRRRAEQGGRSYDSWTRDGFKPWKPKEGENIIRILPETWDDEKHAYDYPIYVHYNVGPDRGQFLCPYRMKGGACPICYAADNAKSDKEKGELRAKQRRVVWIIDRGNETAGPQVWAIPYTLYADIVRRTQDKRTGEEILKIDDPNNGYDVVFMREGTGITSKYVQVEIMREPTPLHKNKERQKIWEKYITDNPLPEVMMFYDAAYMKKVLFGQRAGEAEEEEEERPLRRSRVAVSEEEATPPRRPGRVKPEDDEEETEEDKENDEDDDEDEDEEEEDTVATAPRARKPGREASTNGEDAEGPPWDDDEEAPPPPRRNPPVPPAKPSGSRLSGLRSRR